MSKEEEKKAAITTEATFTKDNLMASKAFGNRKDALMVLLKDNKQYTKKGVQDILDNFMKGEVG